MTLSTHGRLLCACLQSYEVVQAGPALACPGNPSPSSLIGWISEPTAFVGGSSTIDAVVVGETAAEIIIAFRGTEPINDPDRRQAVLDWANDLDGLAVSDPAYPGLVHQGFAASVADLWTHAWPLVAAMAQAAPSKQILVTGHSKGGALAPLAATRLAQAGHTPEVVTFAGARCGDPAFANAYSKLVPSSVRYEYRDDIVPHLPPNQAAVQILREIDWFAPALMTLARGFASVGELRFIDWNGAICADSMALEVTRLGHLAKQIVMGGLPTIIADHGLDPGGGYATAVCPGIWS